MACIGEDGLARYLAGDLEYAEHLRVEAHLVGCAACAEILEELTMRTEIRAVGGDPTSRHDVADKILWLERHYGLQVGDVIAGKYEIEKVIGQGGMGIVVRATHLGLREKVALKFMHPSMADNPSHAARFIREARAAVKLREEHVARVLDLGELEGTGPYIVMEYLEGVDLLEHLKRRAPLPVAEAIELCRQAASGVAAAHEAGIVHRDLKPGNMFMTETRGGPRLKVLDFGVSKYLEGDSLAVTGTHMVVGSPMYMAPELFETARNASPASDVWALGVIFYRMLTGRLPFFAETLPELVTKVHFGRPTPVTHWRPELTPEICEILQTCLARDPGRRYADARAMLGALDRLPAAVRSHVAPPAPVPAAPILAPVELLTLADRSAPELSRAAAAPAPHRPWMSAVIGAAAASLLFGVIWLASIGGSDPEPASPKPAAASEPPREPEPIVTPPVDAAVRPPPADAAPEKPRRSRPKRDPRPRRPSREPDPPPPKEPVLLIPD